MASPLPASDESTRSNPVLALAAVAVARAAQQRATTAAAEAMDGAGSAASAPDDFASRSAADTAAAAAAFQVQPGKGIHASHPYFPYYGLLIHQQNMVRGGGE